MSLSYYTTKLRRPTISSAMHGYHYQPSIFLLCHFHSVSLRLRFLRNEKQSGNNSKAADHCYEACDCNYGANKEHECPTVETVVCVKR